jgi:hypothetical protein
MKLSFLLLLLANLVLLAWQQGAFGPAAEAGREPQRLGLQVAPEKIRLLGRDELAALRGGAEVEPRLACVEFGDFDEATLSRVRARLAELALGDRLQARRGAGAETTRFEIRGVDSALAQRLAELQKEFPQSRLGACGN